MKSKTQKIVTDAETAMNIRYSKKRIKLLEEKSKLTVHIMGRIIFDSRWNSFNLNGELQEWVQKGDINEVTGWLRDNYERLNVDKPKYPPINMSPK